MKSRGCCPELLRRSPSTSLPSWKLFSALPPKRCLQKATPPADEFRTLLDVGSNLSGFAPGHLRGNENDFAEAVIRAQKLRRYLCRKAMAEWDDKKAMLKS